MNGELRVGVCADFREEGWPSMDRVADRLLDALNREHRGTIAATPICPKFRRRAARLSSTRAAANIDRIVNRLVDYPRHAGAESSRFDLFHIVDHSYAQLVHRLPAGRAVVTCHDLDTFRSVLDGDNDPRSLLFKLMTRHILGGLRRAACVTCDTASVRDQLVGRGLVPLERTRVVAIGVAEEFGPDADCEGDIDARRVVGAPNGVIQILHVGSTVPRKRIDLLLRSFAALRERVPEAYLVRVGGSFTAGQEQLARDLGLIGHLSVLPAVSDRVLAGVYRRATVVVLPSEREGFGLPVVEAMACGTPVVASDLPVLREVGGTATTYCRGTDPAEWAHAMWALIRERQQQPRRWAARQQDGISSVQRFTWSAFADRLASVYLEVARGEVRVPEKSSAPCPA